MQEKQYYVYLLANRYRNVFYTGFTSNLEKRMYEHSNGLVDGFTSKYNAKELMYYEIHCDVNEAILREKKIKKWKREWKCNLIDKVNSEHINLYQEGNVLPILQI